MSAKTVLTLSASVLLGAAIAAPNAALAQFGPPPGPPPMLAGPPPGPVAGGPPPVSPAALPWVMLRPDLSLAFRPVAARAHLRAILPLVPILTVRPDCMVSIAADRPVFVASKLAPRPTASTVTSAIVTPATATANGYARSSHYLPYAAAAAYAYGRSYASSNEGCYYVSTYRRSGSRRVLVCHEN